MKWQEDMERSPVVCRHPHRTVLQPVLVGLKLHHFWTTGLSQVRPGCLYHVSCSGNTLQSKA